MKTPLAGLFVLGAMLLGSAPSGVGASNGFTPLGVIRHSGSTPTLRVARATKTAGSFTCGSITCNAYETGVNGYFQDVAAASGAADNVYSVATQYSDGSGAVTYTEAFGGTVVDASAFPASACPTTAASTCLTESQLLTEINSEISAKGWSAGGTHLFVILLPAGVDTCFDTPADGCASSTFCAYHHSSGYVLFAVEPFNATWSCDGSILGQGFPNGAEIDKSLNTLSHEQNEAITDPNQADNAWYSSSGDEIGDLCSWSFGSSLGTTAGGQPYNQVINGHDYSLQLEYSNAANSNTGGCVSHLGGTATGISDGGSGPLTYHGGPVMHTNTVYTIYWIPGATPALSISPAVSGTVAVGKQLSTTNGAWTNSPTGYAYKWQRCNRAGRKCVNIAHATSSKYTLVTADAGHTVRSGVLASNAGGSAASGYAPSATTSPVIGKPVMTAAPKISGTASVGSILAVSTGSWTYSPSFTYQWSRCAAVGTSCTKISGATGSKYWLTSADAGRRVEATVTASNLAGSSKATSALSAAVTT